MTSAFPTREFMGQRQPISLDEYLENLGGAITLRTLCLLLREGAVLLGRRKRGVGVGGKAEKGESIEQATIREDELHSKLVPGARDLPITTAERAIAETGL